MGVYKIKNEEEEQNSSLKSSFTETSFENAIAATGFGKFNYMLLAIVFVPCIAQLVNTVELSYVLPVAECDLELSLEDKGVLNAVMFAGMITTGFFWGFVCDSFGRKNVIVYGYFVNAVFAIIAALSTHKIVLMVAKLMSGVFINGPFSAVTSHIAEYHSSQYRGRVNLARGIFISIGNLLLPVLSWAILRQNWDISVFGIFEIRSWNVFLLICASTTLISGILYIFIPESPKYLMSIGRNDKALDVMRTIYSINTGTSRDSFPIKRLTEEKVQMAPKGQTFIQTIKDGLREMKNIFYLPHVLYLGLACFNAFSLLMSVNTLKLWLPGIFQSISDYQNNHNKASNSMCVMLENLQATPSNITEDTPQICSVDLDNLSVYVNTFIVAFTRIVAFAISGLLIRLLGVKTLNVTSCLLTAAFLSSIYFARSSEAVTALSSVGTALGSVAENVLVTLTLELFPTTLRTIALSIHLTAGRAGTLAGNIIFPYLLYSGCLPPFIFIGLFSAACGMFSIFYKSVENNALK